jgi:hypothetical protein
MIRNQATNNSILLYNNTMAGGGGTQVSISLNTKYDFVLNDNGYTLNGVQYARISSQGAVNTDSLKVFFGGHIRLYSFYIKKDGALVHDFIPVRVGNVGYMYDKVSGQLFGNSGTGSFVLGPDKEYLPLTGGTITGNLTVGKKEDGKSYYFNIYSTSYHYASIYADVDGLSIVCTHAEGDLLNVTASESYFTGDVYGRSFQQSSDLRKKTITGDVPMNIYNVANAPLFKFTWNNETKYSGQHVGSAAQYWQTVLPELVSIGRDADMTLAMQYDVIALASAITVAKKVVDHEERIILLERENEALRQEIADLKSA